MTYRILTAALGMAALAAAESARTGADLAPGASWRKEALTLDGARRIVSSAAAAARERHTTGAIAVVDEGGNLLALERLDGTFAAASRIAAAKARTAALFEKPSAAFEDAVNHGRVSMVALSGGALEDFTPLRGGVPVMSGGRVIGAVGVSGAANAAQDEELAALAAVAWNASKPATFYPAADVEKAFSSGAVLFDRNERYMIHASRRDKPGMAEIHTKDADIVRVLEGSATIVTGGAARNVRETADGEYRGDFIEGGEERRLEKGDVIVIPAGTPHWFKTVTDPFLYFVVKAR